MNFRKKWGVMGLAALAPMFLVLWPAWGNPHKGSLERIQSVIKRMSFISVPGGSFEMGCGEWQTDCLGGEFPAHRVTLSPFEIGKYEVTQGEWKRVMRNNPSLHFSCGEHCPVEQVSYSDIMRFIDRLNAVGGSCRYRLPSEAEWEYACRSGGKPERYCGGENPDRLAWYGEEGAARMGHPVGLKAPNGLGLYDMSGNVQEWVSDRYDGTYYAHSASENPHGPMKGMFFRVLRGGSWGSIPEQLRSTARGFGDVLERMGDMGFRLARDCH